METVKNQKTAYDNRGIVECRKFLGLSQTELAKSAGCTVPYISMIELGKRRCPEHIREAIEKCFNERAAALRIKALEESQNNHLLEAGFVAVSGLCHDLVVGIDRRKDALFGPNGPLKPID